MKNLFFALVLTSLMGCATYTPPKSYVFNNKITVNQSFDVVWQKIINFFSSRNTPIKNLDKASGFLSSEYNLTAGGTSPLNKDGVFEYCDCGKGGFGVITDLPTGNLNMSVTKISDSTTSVTINAFFNCNWYTLEAIGSHTRKVTLPTTKGNSIGKLEKEIFDFINAQ